MKSSKEPRSPGLAHASSDRMDFSRSRAMEHRAMALISGGSHTYAKGADQYPELSPACIARGSGCHVWDADGNEYIEYAMGLRSVTLGHAYPAVVEAAYRSCSSATTPTGLRLSRSNAPRCCFR